MTESSNLVCDFCAQPDPVFMYAHPKISSTAIKMTWNAGHCGACRECGELLEAGDLRNLAQRVLDALAKDEPQWVREVLRVEFVWFYSQISRTRETFRPYSEGEGGQNT